MSNNVLISGYYGMKNTGDDALLQASILGSRRILHPDKIYIEAPKVYKNKYESNVVPFLSLKQRFRGENRLNRYWSALSSSNVLFGGGSVFHTASDIDIKRHLIKLSGSGLKIAVGVSLGPFNDTRAEKACQQFLNCCDFVGLRDKESYDICASLAPNIHFMKTFDLAPSLFSYYPSLKTPEIRTQEIGINLCPIIKNGSIDQIATQNVITAVANSINLLSPEQFKVINLIHLNNHPMEGDQLALTPLRKKISPKFVIKDIHYRANPLHVIKQIKQLRLMVSMRLHAKIFSYLTTTPNINLCYHPKCTQWCNEIQSIEDYNFDCKSIDSDQLTQAMSQYRDFLYIRPRLPVNVAIRKSLQNWNTVYEKKIFLNHHSAFQ